MGKKFGEFSTISCLRCGAARVLEQRCAECGQKPRLNEVNHAVVKRRQAVELVLRAESQGQSYAQADPQLDTFTRIREFSSIFLDGLNELIEDRPRSSVLEDLGVEIGKFRSFIADLSDRRPLRPEGFGGRLSQVGTDLLRIWDIMVEAVTTSDVAQAQAKAAKAQNKLDDVELLLEQVSLAAEAVKVLEETNSEDTSLMQRSLEALTILYPETTFDSLLTKGVQEASKSLGKPITNESAFGYVQLSIVSQWSLDWESMQEKMRTALTICDDESRLKDIASMEESLRKLGEFPRLIFEALDAYAKAVADVTSIPTNVRRLARTTSEAYETSIPVLTWLRLLSSEVEGPQQYLSYELKDATEHVAKLWSRWGGQLFTDLPAHMRHLGAHGNSVLVSEVEQSVTINLRSHKETLSLKEFVSRCLGVLESLMAAHWSLHEALASADITVPVTDEDSEYLGIDALTMTSVLLEHQGCGPILTDRKRDRWALKGHLDSADVFPAALALIEARSSPIHTVSVATVTEEESPLIVPYSAFTIYQAQPSEPPLENAVALVEFLVQCRKDGQPLLTDKNLLWLLKRVAENGDLQDLRNIPLLRRLRELAKQIDSDLLERKSVAHIKSIRTAEPTYVLQEFRTLPEGAQPELPTPTSVSIQVTLSNQSERTA